MAGKRRRTAILRRGPLELTVVRETKVAGVGTGLATGQFEVNGNTSAGPLANPRNLVRPVLPQKSRAHPFPVTSIRLKIHKRSDRNHSHTPTLVFEQSFFEFANFCHVTSRLPNYSHLQAKSRSDIMVLCRGNPTTTLLLMLKILTWVFANSAGDWIGRDFVSIYTTSMGYLKPCFS